MPNGSRLPLAQYVNLVRTGSIYIRPEALALFAKQRGVASPAWLKPTGSAEPAKHPGGAPEKYDWALVEDLLEEGCKQQGGIPRRDHSDPAWRQPADAAKYVRKSMMRDWHNGGPVDSTLKERIGQMLKRIDERMKEAGN